MIKSILAACTGEKPSTRSIEYAVDMAVHFDAHLTGILPLRVGLDQMGVPGWLSGDLKSMIADTIKTKNSHIREQFEVLAREKLSAERVHWIDSNDTANQTLVNYARMYDLTVVASPPEKWSASDIKPDVVALQSGLPILVVPDETQIATGSKPAVVAWDGQRSATRALRDALPLLAKRPFVSVYTVENSRVRGPLPGIDVVKVLERHGIKVERHRDPQERGSVSEQIMQHCRDINAGLLVMGAYEHSKFSEDLFGGVTQDTVKNTTLPVLLSH